MATARPPTARVGRSAQEIPLCGVLACAASASGHARSAADANWVATLQGAFPFSDCLCPTMERLMRVMPRAPLRVPRRGVGAAVAAVDKLSVLLPNLPPCGAGAPSRMDRQLSHTGRWVVPGVECGERREGSVRGER